MGTKKLNARQIKALPLLVNGITQVEVAKAVGVHPQRVSEWVNHDELFMRELQRLQDEATKAALDVLTGSVGTAAQTIVRMMSKARNDAERLKAAQYVVNAFGLKGRTLEDTQPGTVDLGMVLRGLGVRM